MSEPFCQQTIELISDIIPVAVIFLNNNNYLTGINKSAETLLGVSSEQLLEKEIRTLIAEGLFPEQIIAATANDGTARSDTELTFEFNGRSFKIILASIPMQDVNNNRTGTCIIAQDLNYNRANEERMHHLESLAGIGQMAASTIHEIRNPMTSISGFVHLLKGRAARLDDQTSIEYCRLISEEICRINNILSDFLALAKPRDNKLSRLNIVQLVHDVLILMYGEALISQIAILPRLPETPLYILGQAEKIKEVLINICRNAIQAMDAGGTLTITVSAAPNTIYIDLTDTGHGMSENTMAKIFEPFYTTKEAGTGLGLAICQRIIQEHNAEIRVSSEIGKGSTFVLVFPRLGTEQTETA